MVEYIERAAAIVRACKVIQDDFIAFDVKDAIKAIPAADVVPVVRCKDCKHRYDDGFCGGRGSPAQLVPDDGYCDNGARMDGDGE